MKGTVYRSGDDKFVAFEPDAKLIYAALVRHISAAHAHLAHFHLPSDSESQPVTQAIRELKEALAAIRLNESGFLIITSQE